MKNIFNILSACAAAVLMVTACNSDEFLNTSSPSTVDADFVFSYSETSEAAMLGVYEAWRTACNGVVFGDGLYYALDVAGSDIERHPESFTNQPGRHTMECLYQNGTLAGEYDPLSYNAATDAYDKIFDVIGKANAVIGAIEAREDFQEMISAATPTDLSQLYGEAVCARAATYRELIKYYGDVPFATKTGVAVGGLAPRDSIYDCIIADLERVIPVMKPVGAVEKNKFSKTFAQGLVGRLCLEAAGYQTRRAAGDGIAADFYKDGKGNVLTFETKGNPNADAANAVYGRRSDWKDFYKKAQTYFKAVIDDSGSAVWHDTDPRSAEGKRVYNNPYQYFFQQMNNLEYADESIYEYAMTQGAGNDARPYSFGRPSGGGGSFAFPCKAYGQGRINPAYYYGMFDPKDMRRDVSVCVTGSDGKGAEALIPFKPGSKTAGGGLSLNKWDENRMASPYIVKQRQSGINGPYMRLAEIYLGYAEVCAALGDESTALTYLKKVRERSFPAGQAGTEAFVAKYGIQRAVIEERGFEYAGEGDRRWTLIRSGYLPEAIKAVKDLTAKMIEGLKANGSYTFENGNVISSYVWTKTVDAKSLYGYRLTAQCTDETDPVLFPGWRGQNDDWESVAKGNKEAKNKNKVPTAGDKTNLAIKGLFSPVSDTEAAALVADGYKKVNWGKDIADNEDEYNKYLFYDYDYVSAPIYLAPFVPNVLTTGGFTNGYNFKQQ